MTDYFQNSENYIADSFVLASDVPKLVLLMFCGLWNLCMDKSLKKIIDPQKEEVGVFAFSKGMVQWKKPSFNW